MALAGIILSTGVVFAGTMVYEKIWKTPEKIQLSSGDFEEITKITEESKKENIPEEKAKEIANKYYKLFGFKEGEYEISKVWVNNNEGSGKGAGFKIDITYNKKYGDIYNPYESIGIGIESKNKNFDYFRVENVPFDNNEFIINENDAINIALKEDEKIRRTYIRLYLQCE